MNEILKNCPVCGADGHRLNEKPRYDSFWIECIGCGMRTPKHPTLTNAEEHWNKRVDPSPLAWQRFHTSPPDLSLGTILIRYKKTGRGDMWFVSLAYATKSNTWRNELGQDHIPNRAEWLAIPE